MRVRTFLGAATLAACSVALAGDPQAPAFPRRWPAPYTAPARASVASAFMTQASNAHALEQTLWSDFFEKDGDLHRAGALALGRLARRQSENRGECPLVVTVARTPFRRLTEKDVDRSKEDRLDAKRVQAVREYLAVNWPHVPATVAINDPTRVGISASEAIIAVDATRAIAQGFIPDQLIAGGLKEALKSAGARGTTPPTVTPGTNPNASLGTSVE